MSSNSSAPSSDLFKQTLRTVIVLVTACVLFVGALSGVAVAITSRAFATRTESTPEPATAKAETTPAKKPQSI
jgi:hypothetical protein